MLEFWAQLEPWWLLVSDGMPSHDCIAAHDAAGRSESCNLPRRSDNLLTAKARRKW
jgi:hypothetical protein